MKKISPSILAADFNELGKQIEEVKSAGADYLHIDVMDGHFVPNISFGIPVIASIRKKTDMFFDVHLMIAEPIRYIREFADAGADLINIHFEACKDVQATIDLIRKYDKKVGITIKPSTPVNDIYPFIDKVDLILIMSVEPGFGGQSFIESTYGKLEELHALVSEFDNPPEIEVDGGVTLDNAERVLAAGADVLVCGSAVFKGDIAANVKKFKEFCK